MEHESTEVITKGQRVIGNAEMYAEILLSAISPWEFSKLLEKKRVGISCDLEDWINTALDMPKLRLVPLSPVLSYRSTVLPQPFHNDPAGQIIVSTAREENATSLSGCWTSPVYLHILYIRKYLFLNWG